MAQPPQSGSLEQVLRCLKRLALSPAFATEMNLVTSYMGSGAFVLQPNGFVDANGSQFTLSIVDTDYSSPASWVPNAFADVQITSGLQLIPPYPRLELLGAGGMMQGSGAGPVVFDTGEAAGWTYTIDAVVAAVDDRADAAQRSALALMDGLERLVRRNEHLGGLVQLITAEGPLTAAGPVEAEQAGNLAGAMLRFRADVLHRIV